MSPKRFLAAMLVGLLAVSPASAAPLASLAGAVSSAKGPAAGIDLDLVNLDTGRTTTVRTDGAGTFRAQLPEGSYAVSAGRRQLVRGPRVVSLVAGQAAWAALAVSAPEEEDQGGGVAAKSKLAAVIGTGAVIAGAVTFMTLTHNGGPASASR